MAEGDDASRTEDPTAKRLNQGREEGQVASSQEIRNWAVLGAGTLALVFMASPMMHDLHRVMLPFLGSAEAFPMDFEHLQRVFADLSLALGIILAPILGLLVVVGWAGNVFQTGLVYSPGKISPKLGKISLQAGIKRMFSGRALIEFAKGILKIVVVAAVASIFVAPLLEDFRLLFSLEMSQILDRIDLVVLRLMLGAVAVMTVIALLDFVYQKFDFNKSMRMTKQEVREEHKQSEGDPHIKARIRRIRMERAQKRMMAAVPTADVVITNPTHFAVALKYQMDTMNAPLLVAKGADLVALRIRQVAEENEVPIVENPPLARALFATVELDQEIPPDHYKAVAEVIGYVMRLRGELPGK